MIPVIWYKLRCHYYLTRDKEYIIPKLVPIFSSCLQREENTMEEKKGKSWSPTYPSVPTVFSKLFFKVFFSQDSLAKGLNSCLFFLSLLCKTDSIDHMFCSLILINLASNAAIIIIDRWLRVMILPNQKQKFCTWHIIIRSNNVWSFTRL